MVSAEARELAGKTAAEIRRRGWVQATMAEIPFSMDVEAASAAAKNCRVCLVGGIAAALTGDPGKGDDLVDGYIPQPTPLRELVEELGEAIGLHYEGHVYLADLVTWNDKADRTVEEVLAILDSIADAA